MAFEIFFATAPGLEQPLYDEVKRKGFKQAKAIKGGVTIKGGWPEVWRANLWVRGASKILARIGSFKAVHLSHLDIHAPEIPWLEILDPKYSYRVEASCSKSRIYHSGAVKERIENAIESVLNKAP